MNETQCKDQDHTCNGEIVIIAAYQPAPFEPIQYIGACESHR